MNVAKDWFARPGGRARPGAPFSVKGVRGTTDGAFDMVGGRELVRETERKLLRWVMKNRSIETLPCSPSESSSWKCIILVDSRRARLCDRPRPESA